MVQQFYADLNKARQAEQVVRTTLSSLAPGYTFIDVGEDKQYYHIGDIKVIDNETGEEYFIEVKDDSRIAQTHNVLCEEEVYYSDYDQCVKGNMYSNYQYYAVVSRQEKKIYIFDFDTLKSMYKRGEYKVIPHYDQTTYAYLVPIGLIDRFGGLMDVIDFEECL